MQEIDILKKIGFEERAAKIYLTLLKLNTATASKVAEETNIDRTTSYDILAKLIEKGIVSYVKKNNVKYFSPIEPQQLLQDLKEKEESLKSIMPDLMELSKIKTDETTAEIFKGKEGIITILKMILRDREDYIFMGGAQDFCRTIPSFMRQFLQKTYKMEIKGKLICEEGFGDHNEDIIGKNEIYRLCPKEFISTTIKVWDNKTAFFIFKEPYYTILIKNKEIADRQRLFFRYLWKLSKEPNKEHKKKTLIK